MAQHTSLIVGALLLALPALSPAATRFYAFTPDPALEVDAGAPSPEGCITEAGRARGLLTTSSADSTCHSAEMGAFTIENGRIAGQQIPQARFDTAAFTQPLTLGGPSTIYVYYSMASVLLGAPAGLLRYEIYEIGDILSTGQEDYIAREDYITSGQGDPLVGSGTGFAGASFDMPAHTIAAGHKLRVYIMSSTIQSPNVLFGGVPLVETPLSRASYADAGISVGIVGSETDPATDPDPGADLGADPLPIQDPAPQSDPQPQSPSSSDSAGAMPGAGLALLLLAGLRRARARARCGVAGFAART